MPAEPQPDPGCALTLHSEERYDNACSGLHNVGQTLRHVFQASTADRMEMAGVISPSPYNNPAARMSIHVTTGSAAVLHAIE